MWDGMWLWKPILWSGGLDWESLIEWQKPLTTTGLKPVPLGWICMEEAMGEGVNGCVVSSFLTCRILSRFSWGILGKTFRRCFQVNNFIHGIFFFFCELCQLDLPRFVFLRTNFKFPIGSRRLSGSHHITMLLETKCLPLQPHTIRTQPRAFLDRKSVV